MRLFQVENDPTRNWLPREGQVNYYGVVFEREYADRYLETLLAEVDWRHDEAVVFGKQITTKRKTAWYGNTSYEYCYSKVKRYALPWTKELQELKTVVENTTKETYNSCLLNLYHTGEEGVGWHSDGEPDLKKRGAIASVSFGAERRFVFRHKTSEEMVDLVLEHGSLLVMRDNTQEHWVHRLPIMKRVREARVNLTFRTIVK